MEKVNVRTSGNLGGDIKAMEIGLVEITGESLSEVLRAAADYLAGIDGAKPFQVFHSMTLSELDMWVLDLYVSIPTAELKTRQPKNQFNMPSTVTYTYPKVKGYQGSTNVRLVVVDDDKKKEPQEEVEDES